MTTFQQALAEHGSAKRAIHRILHSIWSSHPQVNFDTMVPFGDVTRWVLGNAAAIHAHQGGTQTDSLEARVRALETQGGLRKRVQTLESTIGDILGQRGPHLPTAHTMIDSLSSSLSVVENRLRTLEDAPGPRPNEAEVSALRQRMDSLTELVQKQARLDKPWEDALAKVERDVALLKDDCLLANNEEVSIDTWLEFRDAAFGTEPQTPEARKLLGLDVATPKPEPVYEWIDDKYHFDGKVIGGIYQIYNGEWFAVCQPSQYDWRNHFEMTQAHARAWVEAQFNDPKTDA